MEAGPWGVLIVEGSTRFKLELWIGSFLTVFFTGFLPSLDVIVLPTLIGVYLI